MYLISGVSMNAILLSLALVSLSSQQVTGPAATEQSKTASTFAVQAATVAGAARNCKFDKDMIDEYISLAHARIATLAADKEDNVLAKMDFTNTLVVAAIKAPDEGCKAFNLKFLTALHDLG